MNLSLAINLICRAATHSDSIQLNPLGGKTTADKSIDIYGRRKILAFDFVFRGVRRTNINGSKPSAVPVMQPNSIESHNYVSHECFVVFADFR